MWAHENAAHVARQSSLERVGHFLFQVFLQLIDMCFGFAHPSLTTNARSVMGAFNVRLGVKLMKFEAVIIF